MGNRILRDWTDSEKIGELSIYGERFFTRLIMKADDFGCFPGNVRLLKSYLFPLLADKITDGEIKQWLDECVGLFLIKEYSVDEKPYIQIIDFGQRLRIKKSKYPLPEDHDSNSLEKNKFGYVYLIGTNPQAPVKIGFSLNPWARLKEVGTGNHQDLAILATFKASKSFEGDLHRAFEEYNIKNEWFRLPASVIDFIVETSISGNDVCELLRSNFNKLRRPQPPPELEVEEKKKIEVELEGVDFDELFLRAFDERTCEVLMMTFREIPREAMARELQEFRTKCDLDPTDYHRRDIGGLRKGFQYQLKNYRHGKKPAKIGDKFAELSRILEGRFGSQGAEQI